MLAVDAARQLCRCMMYSLPRRLLGNRFSALDTA